METSKNWAAQWAIRLFRTLAVRNVVVFVAIVLMLVAPIAYTYLRTVEQLLTDTLAAEIAVIAQQSTGMIDTASLETISRPSDRESSAYQVLLRTLGRIQREFDVDNAVVMRRTTEGGYAYIADGSGSFAINEYVQLHDDFPETKPPADQAFTTGKLGSTGLFSSKETKWFQVNAPLLDKGDVVGLLLINKFATPVAKEIQRLQWRIVAGVSAALAVGILVWWFFTVRLTRPLVALRRAATRISRGDLEVEIEPYGGRNELGELTEAFGQMVSDLRESREKIEGYTQLLQREKDSFFRFVPTQFLELLGRDSPVAIQLGDHSPRNMSVMFSDIRSFTALSEFLDAQTLFDFLNEYMALMEPAIQEHGGFVDKFLGDGIMALFEDEKDGARSSSDRAVAAANKMRHELTAYNKKRMKKGLATVRVGVGLHTGDLMLGTVGSPQRLNTTVVGDTVNLASRLEALTAHYRVGVIISEAVYNGLSKPAGAFVREIARVQVRGKSNLVTLFDSFDWETPETRERKEETAGDFGKALALYREGDFKKARTVFGKVQKKNPEDRTAEVYLEKCTHHLLVTPENWEGVDVFLEK